MGDAGALFLGVIISVATIRLKSWNNSKLAIIDDSNYVVAVPLLDTCVAVFSRIARGLVPINWRQGSSVPSFGQSRINTTNGSHFIVVSIWGLCSDGGWGLFVVRVFGFHNHWGVWRRLDYWACAFLTNTCSRLKLAYLRSIGLRYHCLLQVMLQWGL
jgi:UDP-GlcNAc:undecaprenyl-phosphate/decaprenyl-phosphate GlcNAc-1-phosphate transferase